MYNMTYLVLLEDLAKGSDLSVDEPTERGNIPTALFELRMVFGESSLALGRQASTVGAFKA